MMVNAEAGGSAILERMDRVRDRGAQAHSLVEGLRIVPAEPEHYEALGRFHYRAGPPRVISGGWALLASRRSPVARYLRAEPAPEPIGVLLVSPPHLACRSRDDVAGRRYGGLSRREAAVMLNREVRCIGRVVIDPRFRGLGLAVRLVRHALANPGRASIRFTEALASMGRVHPFFERAGMTRHDRPPLPSHARLLGAMERLGIEPATLASLELMKAALALRDPATVAGFEAELRRWLGSSGSARRTPGCRRGERPDLDQLLRAARECLLSQPLYYIFHHARPHEPAPVLETGSAAS